MKLSPLTVAVIAGGAAALYLATRPRAAAAARPGFLDRASTWGEQAILSTKPFVAAAGDATIDFLRRIDPRPDPSGPGQSTIFQPELFYDTMMDRWNYPAIGRAVLPWGPGEGW